MKNKQLSLIFFLSIQLFIISLIVGFSNLFNSDILVILSIFLCFLMTCFLFCKTKDYYIMIGSLFLTTIAEILLLFFKNYSMIAILFLNVVQILYFFRNFIQSDDKKFDVFIRMPIILACTFISWLVLKERFDTIALLFVIYIVNIFLNILFTIKEIGINNFFPIGLLILFIHASLTLFLNIENYTTINIPFVNFVQEMSFRIDNVIYIVAQVILVCSVFTVNRLSFSKLEKDN